MKNNCEHEFDDPWEGYVECKKCCHQRPVMTLVNDLSDECPCTLEHALVHLKSALDSLPGDVDRVRHDIRVVQDILIRLP